MFLLLAATECNVSDQAVFLIGAAENEGGSKSSSLHPHNLVRVQYLHAALYSYTRPRRAIPAVSNTPLVESALSASSPSMHLLSQTTCSRLVLLAPSSQRPARTGIRPRLVPSHTSLRAVTDPPTFAPNPLVEPLHRKAHLPRERLGVRDGRVMDNNLRRNGRSGRHALGTQSLLGSVA